MATETELAEELAQLEARRRTIAGIKATSIGDQSTQFDSEGLDRRIAAIQQQLAGLAGRTRTRLAATSKGA